MENILSTILQWEDIYACSKKHLLHYSCQQNSCRLTQLFLNTNKLYNKHIHQTKMKYLAGKLSNLFDIWVGESLKYCKIWLRQDFCCRLYSSSGRYSVPPIIKFLSVQCEIISWSFSSTVGEKATRRNSFCWALERRERYFRSVFCCGYLIEKWKVRRQGMMGELL